ncbi:MAG: hypothetical protein NTW10_10485 [Bacteroidetes bacterium]|nr:hypothetical protein [Bacteroidota bacterium]
MKTNKDQRIRIREIHSMHELQMERARLELELVKTEDKIKASYKNILYAFSLGNLLSTVTTEFASSSSILAKTVNLGMNWLSRRKKKKKKKQEKQQQQQQQSQPHQEGSVEAE